MNLFYFLFFLLPPSWEFTGEISSATVIYDIIEANDGSLIASGSASSGSYRLWRSTDNGNTWSGVGPVTSSAFRSLLKTSGGSLFAGRDDGWLYRSNDNGANWVSVTDLGLSVFVLFQSSSGRLFAGTATDNAEIYYSDDGNTWNSIDLSGNLDVYCFAQFGTGRIVCGTNSNTVYISDNNGVSWNAAGTLTGASACYSLEVYGNDLYAGTNNSTGEVYKSIDFASSFTNLGDKLSYANVVYDILFRVDTMYLATGSTYGEIAKSLDFGNTFDYTRNLDGADAVYKVIDKSGTLYAGTGNVYGDVFRSADLTFYGDSVKLTGANTIEALAFYNNDLYAGTDNPTGEVYKSTDFASSFTNLGDNMPSASVVYDFLFYPYNFGSSLAIFAGTGPNGDVLMSDNTYGNSWINTGDLTSATYSYSLELKYFSPYANYMFCGTGNNGDVFRTTTALGTKEEFPKDKPPFFKADSFYIYRNSPSIGKNLSLVYHLPFSKKISFEIYNSAGKLVHRENYLSRKGTHFLLWPKSSKENHSDGVYFYTFKTGKNKRSQGKFILIK